MMYFDLRPGSTIVATRHDNGRYTNVWRDDWDSQGVKGVIDITPELIEDWIYKIAVDDMVPGFVFQMGSFWLRCLGYNPWIRAYMARRIDA